ncbi:MAG: hypothetical protein ACREUW_04745 [Burkholderiales bacterium]
MDRRTFLEALSLPAMALVPGAELTRQIKSSSTVDRKIAVGIRPAGRIATYGRQATEISGVEIIDKKISGTYFRGYLNPEWDSATQKLAEFFRDDALILYGDHDEDPSSVEFLKEAFLNIGREFSCARTHDMFETYASASNRVEVISSAFAEYMFAPISPDPDNDTPAFNHATLIARLYLALGI